MVCVGSSAIIKCHQVDSGGAFDPLNGVEFIFGRRGEPSPRVRTANPVGVEHPEHQETVPSSDAIVHCGVSLSVLAVRGSTARRQSTSTPQLRLVITAMTYRASMLASFVVEAKVGVIALL